LEVETATRRFLTLHYEIQSRNQCHAPEGIPYKTGKFPLKALGRSRASGDTEGIIKVIAHKETDEILGVHMLSARAADMIMEAVTIMEFRGSAEDMARISHPHPTYTEAVREAALAATENRSLHI